MGQTIAEKIFSYKVGCRVYADEMVWASVDLMVGTDGTIPLTLSILKEYDIGKIDAADRAVFIIDHFSPAKDICTANSAKIIKSFADKHEIQMFDAGEGICHILVPDKGLVKPGMLIVGADSHTCTYGALGALSVGIGSTDLAFALSIGKLWFKVPKTIRINIHGKKKKNVSGKDIILFILKQIGVSGANYSVLEIAGDAISDLDMADRFSMCNMAAEMGAKSVIFPFDEIAESYLNEKGCTEYNGEVCPDVNANYSRIFDIDIEEIQPQIACPYSPDNVQSVSTVEGVIIDQVALGFCTNGRLEDFRRAARYLSNKKINDRVRLIIVPGSKDVLYQLIKEGIAEILLAAGGTICPSTCGPCVGGHMGVLGNNEVGLYTSSRNFLGRCGDKTSKVYLCSPDTAAYSSLFGYIKEPPEDL